LHQASRVARTREPPVDSMWNIHFAQLEAYHEHNGNCFVPKNYDLSPGLYDFVQKQRDSHKLGSLDRDHKDKLDTLGFCFGFRDQHWHEQYSKLVAFKHEHGHCVVPFSYDKVPSLSEWVKLQRKKNKDGKLKASRLELLNKIDFKWRALECDVMPWNDRLLQLLEYNKQHGHMLVPQRYVPNPQLGQWVQKQRRMRKMNQLQQERIAKLDEVGFVWEVGKKRSEIHKREKDEMED
jgi:hypothetical protein